MLEPIHITKKKQPSSSCRTLDSSFVCPVLNKTPTSDKIFFMEAPQSTPMPVVFCSIDQQKPARMLEKLPKSSSRALEIEEVSVLELPTTRKCVMLTAINGDASP